MIGEKHEPLARPTSVLVAPTRRDRLLVSTRSGSDQGELPDAQVRELGKGRANLSPAPDDYHVRATQHLLADLAPQQRLPGRGKIAEIRRFVWRCGGLTQSE